MFALGAIGSILVVTGVAFGAGTPSTATFTGAPLSPASMAGVPGGAALANFDVQVHSRDSNTWYQLENMNAQHGSDCSAPPATHSTNSYEGAVFQCKDHVMTAINASGYGLIYLTPNQMVDFAGGGSVSFELSTERMSTRDWFDIWVSPYNDNVALPFDAGDVDLQGEPRNTIHIGINNAQSVPIVRVIRNGSSSVLNDVYNSPSWNANIVAGTNQSATRQPFKLTLTPTHIRFERLASATGAAVVFVDKDIPALNWTQGVVQFGHHSYNPTKDGSGVPATRHWDNFTISPSVPFTIIKADRRYIDNASQTLTFAQPAPTGAMLRFSAIGKVDVSFDGGAFQPAAKQWAMTNGTHLEHMSSFWTPMPAGARTVKLRFSNDGWYTTGYPMIAKDFAIFSNGTASVPPPTATPATPTAAPATPTATPATPTATPATPTATPATPTATPAAPTATPATPTATPATPTATPTASPSPSAGTWTLSASATSVEVLRGGTMRIKASVKSSAAANALIDIEIYSPSGTKVSQKVFDNRAFTAGQTRTFDAAYKVPATGETGTYTVKVGVFKPSWAGLYAWNDAALKVTVK
ncbi:MAG: hypothetical protein ACKVT1_08820 [Dehalococcoidia bacterium]